MRKILGVLLAAIAVTVLTITVCAMESGITIPDVTVQECETIYVPVSLRTEVTATAMALEYTYDSAVMEILPEECHWIQKGIMSDFSKNGPQAVWAASGEKKLSGDLCVLAFRLVNGKGFADTEISCSITVRKGSETVGVYQDSAGITKVCSHQFGEWTDGGMSGHTRACTLCKREELQSHNWDAGTESADPAKPDVTVITYQCADCSAEKVVEVPGGNQEMKPTYPETGAPSESTDHETTETRPQPFYPPEHEKNPSATQPTNPSHQDIHQSGGNSGTSGQNQSLDVTGQPRDYNEQTKNNVRNANQNGSGQILPNGTSQVVNGNSGNSIDEPGFVEETLPMAIKVENPTEAPAEDSAAEETAVTDNGSRPAGTGIGTVLAVFAAGALWIFVARKKKR